MSLRGRWLSLADFAILLVMMTGVSLSSIVEPTDLSRLQRVTYFGVLPAAFMSLVLFSLGVYERRTQYVPSLLVQRMIVALLLGGMGTAAIFHSGLDDPTAGGLTGFALGLSFSSLIAGRTMIRLGILPRPFKPRLLVLGAGRRAGQLWKLIGDARDMTVHGFLPMESGAGVDARSLPTDCTIVSQPNSLVDYAMSNGISKIVIAVDERRGALPMRELLACSLQGVEVVDSSVFFERATGRVDVADLKPSLMIFGEGSRRDLLTLILKRCFDIAASVLFLILVLPLSLFTMLAIRLESDGPVFYRQRRVGLNGRVFDILKFRSMTVDAEMDGKPRWAEPNDSRITKVGMFIRRTHIDEIPQAINVLRGEMSFVGPRPERPDFVRHLAEEIPFYGDRHSVKPGITGWAQVEYPYGASIEDARNKLAYDLYYMKNGNVGLDLIILFKTVKRVLLADGSR